MVRPRFCNTKVKQLKRGDGSLTTVPEEMRQVATDFLQDSLSAEALSSEALECRQHIWDKVRPKVTSTMRQTLDAPLQEEEVAEAIRTLLHTSCLGEDGLSPTLFQEYWELVKTDLCQAFQDILDTGSIPTEVGEGLIFLIPKGDGPSEDIRRWRPITTLNMIYKILAKTISLRVQPLLPHLIHASQTGFIKERSILDNIFTFWETTALAHRSQQDLAIILLDFEKAYDKVDWGFLEGTLLRFGFFDKWVKGTVALYSSASSRVLLAGGKGPSFQLARSVRQGCPLAPFLFLFFAESLSLFLTAEDSGVKGISLPLSISEEILDAEFADDTGLFLKGASTNFSQQKSYSYLLYCIGRKNQLE